MIYKPFLKYYNITNFKTIMTYITCLLLSKFVNKIKIYKKKAIHHSALKRYCSVVYDPLCSNFRLISILILYFFTRVNINGISKKFSCPWLLFIIVGSESLIIYIHLSKTGMGLFAIFGPIIA